MACAASALRSPSRARKVSRLIQRSAIDGLFLFECVGNKCIGVELCEWPGVYCDLHVSLSSNEMAPPFGQRKSPRIPQSARRIFGSNKAEVGILPHLTAAKLVHSLADLPLGLLLPLRLPAVPFLLPLGKGNFAFGDAVPEVDPEGHQG